MALQGVLHFQAITIIGRQKIGADQQRYDVGARKILVDVAVPFVAGFDTAVVPGVDYPLALEKLEVLGELIAQMLVARE